MRRDGVFSPAQGGWPAAAAAIGKRVEDVCLQAQNLGQANAAGAAAAVDGLDVEGVLISASVLSENELASGRELFARLAAKLERQGMPGKRPRP